VTDADGSTASTTFSVLIDDDTPLLTVNDIDVNRTAGVTNGTGTFSAGADGGAVDVSTLQWTNPLPGFTFAQTSASTWSATNATQTFFNITVNPDGTYAFDLVTPIPSSEVSSGPLFSGITGGSGLSSFTFTADKFNGAFELVLTASDNNAGADTITISSTELGINGNSIQEQFGETLKLDVVQQPGFETATLTSLAIGVASTGSLKTNDDFSITVHYTTGADVTTQENYDGSGVLSFDIDGTRIVDWVTFTPITNNANFKITGITLEYTQPLAPSDQQLNFSVSGVDGDGDKATDSFTVTLIAGTAGNDNLITGNTADEVSGGLGNDTINAGAGNDILIGGQGNDILTGGTGNDVFKFESITDGTDSITDFTIGNPAGNANADVLNLQDVLGGNATVVAAVNADNAATVGQYIHFSVSGTTATLLVDTAGTSAGVPLATFSVPAGTTDSGLLNQLLANNQIVV
jgi:Ca2+-binding RTX toxin-like protein